MRSALQQLARVCGAAALAGLCVTLATSTVSAQAATATTNSAAKQALSANTTPVKAATAPKAVAPLPQTTSASPAAHTGGKVLSDLTATPAASGAVDSTTASALGPDVVWVPERAGPQLRRKVTGGEKSEKTTYIRQAGGPPVSSLRVEKAPLIQPTDDREKPRVWCVPAGEHVSPINGNLLRDGHLGYEDGGLMLGHRVSNEVWNSRDKSVQVACDKNWAASFQLITELKGKQRRIQILADNLDGPRVLPAGPCIQISRLWYVRGKHGREVDGWWDEPLTLIPLLKPLNVPPPDNDVVGQTNQSFHVNIHIPQRVFAGTYRTTLHVRDLDDPLYEEDIHVEITARPTGARR